MDWINLGTAVGSGATAVAVFIAGFQLHQTEKHQRSAFELRFSDRYDDCISRIDLEVLLDEAPYDSAKPALRRAYYDYFELCEQECFYHSKDSISPATWEDWRSGIESNFAKRSFGEAWADIGASAPNQFDEFRRHFGDAMASHAHALNSAGSA